MLGDWGIQDGGHNGCWKLKLDRINILLYIQTQKSGNGKCLQEYHYNDGSLQNDI